MSRTEDQLNRHTCKGILCLRPVTSHQPIHPQPRLKVSSLTRIALHTVPAILGLMLEHISNERTTTAVADREKMSLTGDVRTQQQPNHPPTNTHQATTQDFFADTHRLTVKAILTQNCWYTERIKEQPTQQLNAVRSLTTSRRLSRSSFPPFLYYSGLAGKVGVADVVRNTGYNTSQSYMCRIG